MQKFIQLHLLTSYPAANLNRDDLGTPKTVRMGNSMRLRVSSQSLKRAWRTSAMFEEQLAGATGTRTKEMGEKVFLALTLGRKLEEVTNGQETQGALAAVAAKLAGETAKAVADVFGKAKAEKTKKGEEETAGQKRKRELAQYHTEQLVHFGPQEIAGISALVESVRASGKAPAKDELALLRKDIKAADIAMFGRMVAATPIYNMEAAAQVAHAMTVHTAEPADDFFTAVDDLNYDESGAGHMGVIEFGAGLFYLYVCIDAELLRTNLQGDDNLARKALRALVTAAATVPPSGKQATFASRGYASFILAEKGSWQPRGLSLAFLEALDGNRNLHDKAIQALTSLKESMDRAYGMNADSYVLDVPAGKGSLPELLDFITE